MDFNISKFNLATRIALAICVCAIALVVAPWIATQAHNNAGGMLLVCKDAQGGNDWFTTTGGPSLCVQRSVQGAFHGTSLDALIVDSLWSIAQKRYPGQAVDAQWRGVARASVVDIETRDWPLFLYAPIPILNRYYAPAPMRECVQRMKTGMHCGL